MGVTYTPIDGEEVSRQWGIVLADMRGDGVPFRVNEGHRTMARQWYFWNLYLSGRGALAAYPSPNAPHIRTGRIDHAIDFWNAAAVLNWLHKKGLSGRLTVPGESWHVEVPADQLERYAKAHAQADDPVIKPFYMKPFRKPSVEGVKKLQKFLKALGMKVPVNGKYDLRTRRAVRRFQHRHGLKVDGVVGPGTWKLLRKLVG